LGVEADIQAADIHGSRTFLGPFPEVGAPPFGNSFSESQNINWFGTVRGRVGVAFNTVLLYGTGGLIYGDVKTHQDLVFPAVFFLADSSSTRTGWTAGAGIEWAFAPNWSVKFEGLYYDLGNVTTAAIQFPGTSVFTDFKTFDFHGAIARVGVNYKFGWGGPVVANY
jgi:outer membrane immunogenic protein